MKKLKFSNKFKIIFSVLVIGIILPIFIVCAFYRPTTLNKYIVNKLYNEPVNNYFTDQNFYNCVIDAYNDENKTSYAYTYNLSDEELSSIKKLDCKIIDEEENKKINDTTGLDKLINLTYLDLSYNNISSIDVSDNTKLTYLDVSSNQLTELDVKENTSLTTLISVGNNLEGISLSSNTLLTVLNLTDNKISQINLVNNVELSELYLSKNNLTEIDLSKNDKLEFLSLYSNKLTTLSINNMKNLKWLQMFDNKLTTLDVASNTKLEYLNLYSNNIGEINISENIELTNLDLYSNNLTKLDLSNNTKLVYFSIYDNKFTSTNVIYKNEKVVPNIPIKFFDKVTLNLQGVKDNLFPIESNKLSINESGLYDTVLSYEYSLGESEYTFDVSSTFNVLELTSDNYIIDEENSIIYYNDSFSKDNIKVMLGDEEYTDELLSLDYSDNKLTIKYDDSVIKTFDVKTIKLTSSIYLNIDNGYIYLGSDDIDLSKITSNIGVLNINTTLNNLEVKYNDKVYKTIPIIKTNLSNYVIKGDDIYAFNEDLDINKISSTNASFEIDNDLLKLVYNDTILKTYNIKKVTINSDKYLIKDSNIYVNGTFDITKISVTNATLNVNGNKLELLINNEVIKEYDIVEFTVTSDIYEIIDKYVYSYNLDVNPNYITASIGEVVIDNDTVKIMYNDTTIDIYKLIYVNSDEYKIGSDYVFVSNSTFSLNKISSNGTLSINNSKLELKDNDVVLKSFDITSIDFGDLRVSDKIITLNEEMSYSDFIKNITTTGVTYKIEKDVTTSTDDPKYEEITSGNITGGLLLRVYKNDEIIAYYSINEGYYRIIDTSVKVDQIRAYISNVKDRLTVEQIKQIVETSGTITILDKEDNVKESTLLVGTGDKIKIDLGNDRIFTYTLIVKGDVDGDGEVTTIDALNIVNHILGRDELKDIYLKAGNVDEDDEMSTIDALNIVNYILGKESSL